MKQDWAGVLVWGFSWCFCVPEALKAAAVCKSYIWLFKENGSLLGLELGVWGKAEDHHVYLKHCNVLKRWCPFLTRSSHFPSTYCITWSEKFLLFSAQVSSRISLILLLWTRRNGLDFKHAVKVDASRMSCFEPWLRQPSWRRRRPVLILLKCSANSSTGKMPSNFAVHKSLPAPTSILQICTNKVRYSLTFGSKVSRLFASDPKD